MLKQTPKKRVLFVRRFTPVALAVFGVFSFALLNVRATPVAHAAQLNKTVNFQARLQTAAGGIVPDGDYNVEFKLYSASSGGTALWTEDYLNSNDQGLSTVNGYLSTSLGSITAFPGGINWNQQLWVTMNIGGTGSSASWDGEMNPRLQLTAVPYAFQAGQLAQSNSDGSLTSNLSIQAPTVGNQNFVIQDQGAAGTYNLLTTNEADAGYIKLQGATPGTAQTGHINITGTAAVGDLQVASGGGLSAANGALTLGGTNTATYTSPVGNSMNTKIKIPSFDPGAGGQIVAFGLTSGANGTSSALTIVDARTSAHTPSIQVLSPDETKSFGLSWDGSNSTAVIKTSASNVALQANGLNVLTGTNASGASIINIGVSGSSDGKLQLSNAANSNKITLQATSVSGSYTIGLPSSIGSVGDCLVVDSVASGVETLVHGSCGTGGGGGSLQDAYTGSGASPNIVLDSAGHGIKIQDASSPVGGNLFAIQNNAGTTDYLAVTTTGTSVTGDLAVTGDMGIGTATPGRPLDVVTNNSTTNAPSIKLEQQGTGDTSIEFKDANGKSYFVGMDQSSGGTFKIASSTSATSSFHIGQDTFGNATQGGYGNVAIGYKVASGGTGGTATGITFYATSVDGAAPHVRVALYAHDAVNDRPGTLIAGSGSQTATVGYNTVPISATISSSTTYWVVVSPEGDGTSFKYIYQGSGASPTAFVGMNFDNPWQSTADAPYSTTDTKDWTFYLDVTPSGAVDSFNGISLFSLTDMGALTLQNSVDSGSAFQVQNASGVSMFNVGTSDQKVTIGPSGGDATGTLLVLGARTATGDPDVVDGAIYYNATSKTFRCGEAGVWVSCIGGILTASTEVNSTVANTTTETAFSKTFTIPEGYCATGRVLRVSGYGLFSGKSGDSLTVRIKLASTTIATTQATNFSSNWTAQGWTTSFTIMCPEDSGTGKTLTTQGMFTFAGDKNQQLPYTTSSIDTDTDQELSITAQWSAADTGNTITLNSFILEGLGGPGN